jgi:hypothetical protein
MCSSKRRFAVEDVGEEQEERVQNLMLNRVMLKLEK